MRWLLAPLEFAVIYAVSFFLAPYYGVLAGEMPFTTPWMAAVLTVFLAVSGICLGVTWERINDEGYWQEPLMCFGFLLGVMAIPILLYHLPGIFRSWLVTNWISILERYRYLVALSVLVSAIIFHEIDYRLFLRVRRKIEERA